MLTTPEGIKTLQKKLYTKAKQEPAYRFYALYDKICRADALTFAFRLVSVNKGSPGVDGMHFEDIEHKIGVDKFLLELTQALKKKTYAPDPVRRLMISRPDGSLRPLAIPTIRDRVAQMAVKLMIEPIFEADLSGTSYGFRLMRSAHDAAEDMTGTLWKDYTNLIDADLSKYYDTIPHDKLLHMIAGRIVDSGILQIVKLWLNAPVIDEEESGCAGPGARKNVDGTKGGLREKILQC